MHVITVAIMQQIKLWDSVCVGLLGRNRSNGVPHPASKTEELLQVRAIVTANQRSVFVISYR
jgi:hypothetical protein